MQNKGITLVSLIVTIIILIIIASISINIGSNMIKKAGLEELKTNMLLIQAKAKEYVEEANFKMGKNPDDEKKQNVRNEVYVEKAKLKVPEIVSSPIDLTDCYELTKEKETYQNWGLDKIELDKDEHYLVKFDEQNMTVEVYNIPGYKDTDGQKYSLTDIDKIEE